MKYIFLTNKERSIYFRGTYAKPIEFHIKENFPDALIGHLLHNNTLQLDETKSPTELFSAKSPRKDRQLNSKYTKNSTFKPLKKMTTVRKYRHTKLDTAIFIPVTPTVYFDKSQSPIPDEELLAQGTASAYSYADPVGRRYKFQPQVKEVDTRKRILYERKSTFDNRNDGDIEPVVHTFETFKSIRRIQNDSLPADVDSMIEEESTSIPLVIITPRPTSRIPKQTNLFVARPNSTVPDATVDEENRSYSSASIARQQFLIANQQDVTDMITISNDGAIMTVKGLDRETRDMYHLTVIAEYSKGFVNGAGIYQVIIHVDDVNDNAPEFNAHSYSGIIAENSALGTTVQINQQILVRDADIGDNAMFSVTLVGAGSELFVVELVNGTKIISNITKIAHQNMSNMHTAMMDAQAFLNVPYYVIRFIGPKTLDRERESSYNLTLFAIDSGGLHSEAKVLLQVTDVNDNAPMFERIAVFKDSGIKILEQTNELEIYFADQKPDVGVLTGKLSSNSDIVAERLTYTFKKDISAVAKNEDRASVGTPRKMKLDRLLLRTRKSKQYEMPQPFFSINENVAVGNTIFKVTAIDEDQDSNAQVFYEISAEVLSATRTMMVKRGTDSIRFFDVDRLSGEVKVIRPLPAETDIKITIIAKDIGDLSDNITVKIKILDINDNPPLFEKTWYSFDINEGYYTNNVLGKITATDKDYGVNANITYAIDLLASTSIPFVITPQSGILKVKGELDRETIARYEFKIIATDLAEPATTRLSSLVEVEVNILDLNDNAPEFTGYDEIFYVRSDLDTLSRTLSDVQSVLIDGNDAEERTETIPVYQAYLNKNVEPGTFVKKIKAIDMDFAGNGNGLVMYGLQHNLMPYYFEIDSREGVISTVARFKRVRGYEHLNLTIIASDLGNPSKSATALLLVNLQGEDLEDYQEDGEGGERATSLFPNKYYEIEVEENGDVPMELIQINVSAIYQDIPFKWSIISDAEDDLMDDPFLIDSKNGSLWLVQALDRESKDTYKIKLRAERQVRVGRNMMPNIVYPVVGERLKDLDDNELRVSYELH